MESYSFTSESVTGGHPDKLADQISDRVLDTCLAADPASRVAAETFVKTNTVVVGGEITTTANLDIVKIVEETVAGLEFGDGSTPEGRAKRDAAHRDSFLCEFGGLQVLKCLVTQSPDIARGVDGTDPDQIGAGDQGMMFGFATNETDNLMPTPIDVAHALTRRMTSARVAGEVEGMRPDGKAMVTVRYEGGRPTGIENVLISTQHDKGVDQGALQAGLREQVVEPVLASYGFDGSAVEMMLNPTGAFQLGGAYADAGLTGRKIIVDTYGGMARHGGGAFSGKDPSKVDRSAAYAARWVAKHVVAAGAADRCEVQVAYAIGVARPVSLMVETFGTEHVDPAKISAAVQELFDLRPAMIVADLDLRRPIYSATSVGGHFGRTEPEFTWEATPRLEELASSLGI